MTDEGRYSNSTFDIISRTAYLIGVPKRIFENEFEPPKIEIYEELSGEKNARIIRNLCMLRTAIEKNFKYINEAMRFDFRDITTLGEYLPTECFKELAEDGVRLTLRAGAKLYEYVTEINKNISDRINNCKNLYPIWINWDYIRDLFIMPDGLTMQGTQKAADKYYANQNYYPYQVYFNWNEPADCGNILYNDKKFVWLLYSWHNDKFTDYSRVSDVGSYTKNNIYDLINASAKTVFVVDCENSDPYKLCASLTNLDQEIMQKVSRIILFDDVHAATAWSILESYTDIPVEYMMIERLKSNKSLVDIKLTARACEEFYKNNVDSFVIVSSDSDYWGLISSLPDAKFLVMAEHEKCGPDIRQALSEKGIFYCFIDDFYSGNSQDIKLTALMKEMYRYLDENLRLNVNVMLNTAMTNTRIEMSPSERQQFYDKYIRNMTLHIDDEGYISVELGRK
ncbi:MAG: NYN domain-containing protein [Clostridiales bacterium]|nr:NYN domain-containing protein [Clostridiales bacterium]